MCCRQVCQDVVQGGEFLVGEVRAGVPSGLGGHTHHHRHILRHDPRLLTVCLLQRVASRGRLPAGGHAFAAERAVLCGRQEGAELDHQQRQNIADSGRTCQNRSKQQQVPAADLAEQRQCDHYHALRAHDRVAGSDVALVRAAGRASHALRRHELHRAQRRTLGRFRRQEYAQGLLMTLEQIRVLH